jgi:hypothetical protein
MDCHFLKINKILQKINNNHDTKINKKQTIGQKTKQPKNQPKTQKVGLKHKKSAEKPKIERKPKNWPKNRKSAENQKIGRKHKKSAEKPKIG